MQRNVSTRTGLKHWSETRWLGGYNPADGVGLFLHAGRFRHDVELWWAQTAVYLPNGKVAVDRSWGRTDSDLGVTTSVFDLLVPQPSQRITSRFDGAMEVVSTQSLAEAPCGSGGNSVPVKWELEATSIREEWDMFAHLGQDAEQEWARGGHTEQHHRVLGEITVDGRTYSLDGLGYDDHSNGVREWAGFGSHVFCNVPFEDFGIHMAAIQTPDGTQATLVGGITRRGEEPDPIVALSTPLMENALGGPLTQRASLATQSGRRLDLEIEVVHCIPITITETHNDNINGLDWNVPGNPLFFSECVARYTTADGDVTYGHLERSARRDRLDRDTFAVRDPWTVDVGDLSERASA